MGTDMSTTDVAACLFRMVIVGNGAILPAETEQFAAFRKCSFESVKVVILGQDPYPTRGHAHGLSFSVPPGVAVPRSLRNIYVEMEADVGVRAATHGCLVAWAEQGVLLLNAVLTVREGARVLHRVSHARRPKARFRD
eukprot:2219439-Pleurochrysis_carterae.AAC.2